MFFIKTLKYNRHCRVYKSLEIIGQFNGLTETVSKSNLNFPPQATENWSLSTLRSDKSLNSL